MKKIIIAIDSFKGCLTSAEAGKAAEKGIKSINPSCHTSVIPIADGGEGLLDVLKMCIRDRRVSVCGTGTYRIKFSGFSRQHAYAHYCLVPKDAAYCQVRISWWICLP